MSHLFGQKIDSLINLIDDNLLQKLTLNPFWNGDKFDIQYTLSKSKIHLLCNGYISRLSGDLNVNLKDIVNMISNYVGLQLEFNSDECIVYSKGHNSEKAGPRADPVNSSHRVQCLYFNNPVNAPYCKNKNFCFEIELLNSQCKEEVSNGIYDIGIGLIGISKELTLTIEKFQKLYQNMDMNEERYDTWVNQLFFCFYIHTLYVFVCELFVCFVCFVCGYNTYTQLYYSGAGGKWGWWENGSLRDLFSNTLFLKTLKKNGYFDNEIAKNAQFSLHNDSYIPCMNLIRIYSLSCVNWIYEDSESESDSDDDDDGDDADEKKKDLNENKNSNKKEKEKNEKKNENVKDKDPYGVTHFSDHFDCSFDIDMSCLPYLISSEINSRYSGKKSKGWKDEYCFKWNKSDTLSMIVDNKLNRISFYKNNHHLIGNSVDLYDRDKPQYEDPIDFIFGYSNLNEKYIYYPVLQSQGCRCFPNGGFTYKVKLKQLLQL